MESLEAAVETCTTFAEFQHLDRVTVMDTKAGDVHTPWGGEALQQDDGDILEISEVDCEMIDSMKWRKDPRDLIRSRFIEYTQVRFSSESSFQLIFVCCRGARLAILGAQKCQPAAMLQ